MTTAILLGLAVAPAHAAESGQRLVLGRISGEPHKHLDRLRAMADYLAVHLADSGISGVDVLITESPERMRSLLQEGKVDLFSETAFVALDFMNDGTARPLLREWKKGVAQYHSVVVVRKDSGLESLNDLVGRKFAFEDPGSTSGYLMPRAALEDAGLKLWQLPDPRNPVPDGAVGYSFARGEVNVIAWVNRGLADAGAVNNLDWIDPETAPSGLKNELRVIHETEPVIRSLILARPSLDDALCDRIKAILETMHDSDEGRAVLKMYFKVARYDRLEGDALNGLETARTIWRRVQRQTD
ncbi:MAG: phosphate/phosphite/phosphonate ABC transporter substrate-binding protein [Alphaproteobacteria bacterium]|nr:phosphate/phosphite/phosphonate ABC transporter substrate-binding protein [Alphaproteobacteria bacterium]